MRRQTDWASVIASPPSMAGIRNSDGATVRFERKLRVGRGADNDLVIGGESVSTYHACLEWRRDGFYLNDLGSRNGTALGTVRVTDWTKLTVGDVVRFGPDAAWTVDDLTPPTDAASLTRTVDAGGMAEHKFGAYRVELTQRGEFGDITVTNGPERGVWTEQELRFHLLWVLADAGGDWVEDEALRTAIWGRRAAENQASSTLAKLIHDTRVMIGRAGLDGAFIEKRRGRTRLLLQPAQLVLR